ncbi:MAG TPA: hypothetical protein VGX71_05370 [Pseudaminobacter sp.]|nr:hypothetical protein [Pseudaminobacter sp.]
MTDAELDAYREHLTEAFFKAIVLVARIRCGQVRVAGSVEASLRIAQRHGGMARWGAAKAKLTDEEAAE